MGEAELLERGRRWHLGLGHLSSMAGPLADSTEHSPVSCKGNDEKVRHWLNKA